MSLTHAAAAFGVPAIVRVHDCAFGQSTTWSFFVAIAFAIGRSVRSVIVEGSRSTIVLDLITAPLIFVFAWVYAAFGPLAAAALWVPILGLRQVHRINLELERTNEELLELMVKSLEARDPYTSGHSRRVQHYSMIIARALGLSDRRLKRLGALRCFTMSARFTRSMRPCLRNRTSSLLRSGPSSRIIRKTAPISSRQ